MTRVTCILAALLAVADPEEPVTLSQPQLTTMLGRGAEAEKLLKEYHGRTVRLTGKVTVRNERVEVWVFDRRPRPTQALVPVEFADATAGDAVRELVAKNVG